MPRHPVVSHELTRPVGPFSAAVTGSASLFLSGQVGQDPATGMLVTGDAADQLRQILANVAALLRAADRSLDDVLRVGLYLTDMADYAAVNTVYAEAFKPPSPARTAIAVVALPLGARVEMDLICS